MARELAELGLLPQSEPAPCVLVFSCETSWAARIQPQGEDIDYQDLAFRWYGGLGRLDVDVVEPGADQSVYRLVLVPSLFIVSDAALAALEATGAEVLLEPRTDSKTRDFAIPDRLPPGPAAGLAPSRVLEVSSLRPGLAEAATGEVQGRVERWRDHAEAGEGTAVEARFADGGPALMRRGNRGICAAGPMPRCSTPSCGGWRRADLAGFDLPEGVRLRRRGGLTFAFNYGDEPWSLPVEAHPRLGSRQLGAGEVAIW